MTYNDIYMCVFNAVIFFPADSTGQVFVGDAILKVSCASVNV